MPSKKIEPALEQVLEAGYKGSGVNERLVEAMQTRKNPPLAELLAYQKRVNQNLANEKAAADSGDFD